MNHLKKALQSRKTEIVKQITTRLVPLSVKMAYLLWVVNCFWFYSDNPLKFTQFPRLSVFPYLLPKQRRGNQHDCWQSIIAELKRLCKELTFRSDFLGEFERDIVALASTYSVTEFVVYIGSTTKVNHWTLSSSSL